MNRLVVITAFLLGLMAGFLPRSASALTEEEIALGKADIERLKHMARFTSFEELEFTVERQIRNTDFRVFLYPTYRLVWFDNSKIVLGTHLDENGKTVKDTANYALHRGSFFATFNLLGTAKKETALRKSLEVEPWRLYLTLFADMEGYNVPDKLGKDGMSYYSGGGGLTVKWKDWVYLNTLYGFVYAPVTGGAGQKHIYKLRVGIPRYELYLVGSGYASSGSKSFKMSSDDSNYGDAAGLNWRLYPDIFTKDEDLAERFRWIGIHDITATYQHSRRYGSLRYRAEDLGGYVNLGLDYKHGEKFYYVGHAPKRSGGSVAFNGTLSLLAVTRWLQSVPLNAPSHGLIPLGMMGVRTFGTPQSRVPSLGGEAGYNYQFYVNSGFYHRENGKFLPTAGGGVTFRYFAGSGNKAMETYGFDFTVDWNLPEKLDIDESFEKSIVAWAIIHVQF